MFFISFVLTFFIAFFVSLAAAPIAIKVAHKIGAVDVPKDGRRMHTKPMPRFGGMSIFLGVIASLLWIEFGGWPLLEEALNNMGRPMFYQPIEQIWGVILGGILIYILGIVDDLRGLPAKVKFLGQILVACVPFAFGIRIEFITNHFGVAFGDGHSYFAGFTCFMITIIWIVGITNTVNLIDGLDGLAAGVSAICSLCLAYIAYIHGGYISALGLLAVAGGALGFLPFNFNPAKIFMGDGGSLLLGYMLATLSVVTPVKGATIVAMAIPILVLGVPIFDTAFAILRRIINRRPIMEADKGHLHHRIMDAGFGQRRTVMTLYGVSGIMGVAAVMFSRDLFVEMLGLVAIGMMYIYVFLTDATNFKINLGSATASATSTAEASESEEVKTDINEYEEENGDTEI